MNANKLVTDGNHSLSIFTNISVTKIHICLFSVGLDPTSTVDINVSNPRMCWVSAPMTYSLATANNIEFSGTIIGTGLQIVEFTVSGSAGSYGFSVTTD